MINKNYTFQEEKDQILESLVNDVFIKAFCSDSKDKSDMSIELFLTPNCNQTCSYCYLCKYKDELYPEKFRDEKIILDNLKILLDYFLEKNIKPSRFDLFSGEIWGDEFGNQVFDIILEYLKKGLSLPVIIIPSNFSFILENSKLSIIENYLEKFKELKCRLVFSCSNDGYYLDLLNRPLNNQNDEYDLKKGTQEYYDCLFQFCKKWNFGFHPMIAASGIEYWSKNFIWWEQMMNKYEMFERPVMYLEVRNNDWTEEKIIEYLKYINVSINYLYENKSISFINYLNREIKTKSYHYSPIFITKNPATPGCTLHRSLVIRVGDLAIVPCHRTSYDEFVGGNFKIENNKIIGITAKNIQIMNQIWLNNMMGNAKCGTCDHRDFCMKGCYGSQFESTGELLYPCETVCNLYKARNIFLYEKYKKMNILTKIKGSDSFCKMIQKIKDTEEYKKWNKIIQEII